MNPVTTNESELYDINNYTDTELYELLDLNHPTDRELEAKILSYIRNYESVYKTTSRINPNSQAGKNAKQMIQFFENIYEHFFETEEEEEAETHIEGFTSQPASIPNQTSDIIDNKIPDLGNNSNVNVEKNIGYTKTFDYSKSNTNPLLKETITRVISIDSQFRDQSVYSESTNFTFNLSDTLQDVVSLKLYSIQLPYTWWTVNKNYGSNFFYLKANSPGIVGNDYKIAISSGTYQEPADLVTAIQASIQTLKNTYTDVSFGTTNLTIGAQGSSNPTSLASLTIDITNLYNEFYYYLDWGYWTNDSTSIPGLFGFQYRGNTQVNGDYPYIANRIFSNSVTSSSLSNTSTFYIDASNNFFNIHLYDGNIYSSCPKRTTNSALNGEDLSNNVNISNILTTFKIQLMDSYGNFLADGSYNRNTIFNSVNYALQNTYATDPALSINPLYPTSLLNPTLSNINSITDPLNSNNSIYELTIQLNRFVNPCNSKSGVKTAIEFPYEPYDQVWNYFFATGQVDNTGCFYFQKYIYELNEIISEKTSQIAAYDISSSPIIFLHCDKSHYDNSYNDISINITNNKYPSLTNYLTEINTQFQNISYTKNSQVTNQNINGNNPDSLLEFDMNIYKRFDQTMYRIDFSNCYITRTMGFNQTYSAQQLTAQSTFSNTSNSFPVQTGGYQITTNNNTFFVYPDIASPGTKNGNYDTSGYIIQIPVPANSTSSYSSYSDLQTAINAAFTNTIPQNLTGITSYNPSGGTYINTGTNIITPNISVKSNDLNQSKMSIVTSISNNITYLNSTLSFTVYNILDQTNYLAYFYDPSSSFPNGPFTHSTWATYFGLDPSYNLNNSPADVSFQQIMVNGNDLSFSSIYGKRAVTDQTITINSSNQTFYLRARPNIDGIATYNQSTDISFTIPIPNPYTSINIYTKEQLIDTINTLFSQNPITKGTTISINSNTSYTTLRPNINNVYTAKDYNVVFYDIYSFVYCNIGVTGSSSRQNVSQDATLGWILGFRSETVYNLSNPTTIDASYNKNVPSGRTIYNGNIATLQGDTTVNTNLYNYFLLVLDDYTQNHLNDGLVTLITKDNSIPLPSYAERSTYVCDPITGKLSLPNSITNTNLTANALTQKQLYAANAILQSQHNNSTVNHFLSSGPFIQDVFAMIPIKLTSLNIGQVYVEYGGTLQQQERAYFGPVNIHRMSVKLITDRGDILDLNNANWSFALVCQQLYNPPQN
jgi:hypothetical protein